MPGSDAYSALGFGFGRPLFLPVKELRQRSFLRGSPSGPVLGGPPALAPANFLGGAPPGRGRNSRGRSSRLPALPSKGLRPRAGGPSVRGVKRAGRSPEAERDPDRGALPEPNSPRGRKGREPEGAGLPSSAGRSVRGRNGLLPAKDRSGRSPGRSVFALNGLSPPDGLPAAGRNGFPP